jgi:uncharacterized protein YlaI
MGKCMSCNMREGKTRTWKNSSGEKVEMYLCKECHKAIVKMARQSRRSRSALSVLLVFLGVLSLVGSLVLFGWAIGCWLGNCSGDPWLLLLGALVTFGIHFVFVSLGGQITGGLR